MNRTIFLVGPTAVGKSAVAHELARRLDAEVVSADSMQVYRGMDIGTAKDKSAHLVDICDVTEAFDVKRYVKLATATVAEIYARGRTALVVGGTGMYVRALRQGLFAGPGRDERLRARLEALSAGELFTMLQRVDPVTAATIDRFNPRRLVRALEVYQLTGKSLKAWQGEWAGRAPPGAPLFGLRRERADLVARIERRIDEQMAAGWLAEVRRLGPVAGTARQAAGYRELAAHLRGELTLSDSVALIKARTRQLAKRQMTWFRREPGLIWVDVKRDESAGDVAGRMLSLLEDA